MENVVYILQSETTGKYYIGQTEDLEDRLNRHNRGDSKSTKTGRPWKVVHVERYNTRSETVLRERYLKSPNGFLELKKIKENISKFRNVAQPG